MQMRMDAAGPCLPRQSAPRAGRFWIHTRAATDAQGTEAMRRATGEFDFSGRKRVPRLSTALPHC